MRTLDRNKTTLWIVEPASLVPKVDSDGFETGEMIKVYGTPTQVNISIYPSYGSVVEQIFGKDISYDMMAVSNDVVLSVDTLLFLTEPTGNYDTTYDFRVDSVMKSLNTCNYGLRSRT